MNEAAAPADPPPARSSKPWYQRWTLWLVIGLAVIVLLPVGWLLFYESYPQREMSKLVDVGSVETPYSSSRQPVVYGDNAYFASERNEAVTITAVDLTTGERSWETRIRAFGIVTELVAERGFLYLRGEPGLQFVNLASGELHERVPVQENSALKPVGDALVVRNFASNKFVALDKEGKERWSVKAPREGKFWGEMPTWDQVSTPPQDDGDYDERLWSVDNKGQARVWDAEGELLTEGKLGTEYNAQITAYNGQLIVAAGNSRGGHDYDKGYSVTAYGMEDLKETGKWTAKKDRNIPMEFTVCGDVVICLSGALPDPDAQETQYTQVKALSVDGGIKPLWNLGDEAKILTVTPV